MTLGLAVYLTAVLAAGTALTCVLLVGLERLFGRRPDPTLLQRTARDRGVRDRARLDTVRPWWIG